MKLLLRKCHALAKSTVLQRFLESWLQKSFSRKFLSTPTTHQFDVAVAPVVAVVMGHRHRLDDIVKGQIKTDLKCDMTPKAIAEVTGYH